MKRVFLCFVCLIVLAGLVVLEFGQQVSSQSGRTMKPANSVVPNRPASNAMANTGFQSAYKYYLEIDRPGSGYLSHEIWRQIGVTVQRAGIPTIFGTRNISDYGEDWMPASIIRTSHNDGVLILGPFSSPSKAIAVLNRLPKVLPRKYDDPFEGLRPGPTETPNTWQIGSFQIWGFKSNLPIGSKKATVAHKAGVMDATVIEFSEGGSGSSLIVDYKGVKYSFCLYGNCGAPRKVLGNVTEVGSRVRIWYKLRRPYDDGSFGLEDVAKVQRIK